jgi:hypothetical protein
MLCLLIKQAADRTSQRGFFRVIARFFVKSPNRTVAKTGK